MNETLYEKVWNAHTILQGDDGQSLLHVGRHLVQDGSLHAFEFLQARGIGVRRPDQTFATPDHGVSTQRRDIAAIKDPDQRRAVDLLAQNAAKFGIVHFALGDPRQGIVHVVGPEQGLTQPGMLLVCGDSHTSTHGALGALAFGLGASDILHVLATQTTWQKRSKTMRVTIDGNLSSGVTAKDLILKIIARIGANGATGHVIEYAGATIRAMSIEERLTICNMSIEAGARAGMIAPDETTYTYMEGRPFTPKGAQWERALAYWRTLPSDPDAIFDKEIHLDASAVAPMVTWGNSPEDALPVDAHVPDPATESNPQRRAYMLRTLKYMGLEPGMALTDIQVDQVFIGSCTNARLEDLRAASSIAKGGRAVIPALVSPGSTAVRLAAEAEGLDRIFRDAGFTWGESGCSMCVGMNGDIVAPGKRCASTSNRNFVGRQGTDSRTHLLSPAMAAAAALTGRITDIRKFGA
ncbi:3-isopropylmalate dehydratase large subunit [Pollutimonas nitritireducens]|uniref:3-isopropylmalate dehydratase large subunit n=1 Tax=Pollutimonas nitritireducens TaxID=2045209 RepID=A0A2N4ULK9_9BURK|nr:3-isopropylmalate dehydratase large subunit [Pollutimonas nitritireducens]PLC55902.1 3-isopropylmalate dehydratase large subunit [Pollutimonas nitritireducens]